MIKYYSTQRPVAPGTFPKEGVNSITNFDTRKFIPEINRYAWGYIEYDTQLSGEDAAQYELVQSTQD